MLTSLHFNVSFVLLIRDGKQRQVNGHASTYATRIGEDTTAHVRKVWLTACGMFTHLRTTSHILKHNEAALKFINQTRGPTLARLPRPISSLCCSSATKGRIYRAACHHQQCNAATATQLSSNYFANPHPLAHFSGDFSRWLIKCPSRWSVVLL